MPQHRNAQALAENERKQLARGNAALAYHFFVTKSGVIQEGRPLEIMGGHAGVGKVPGPLSDPDWGAIGIVLQGDYHHGDDLLFSQSPPAIQIKALERLVIALRNQYLIETLLMHREVDRAGTPTLCPGDELIKPIEALRKRLRMKGKTHAQ